MYDDDLLYDEPYEPEEPERRQRRHHPRPKGKSAFCLSMLLLLAAALVSLLFASTAESQPLLYRLYERSGQYALAAEQVRSVRPLLIVSAIVLALFWLHRLLMRHVRDYVAHRPQLRLLPLILLLLTVAAHVSFPAAHAQVLGLSSGLKTVVSHSRTSYSIVYPADTNAERLSEPYMMLNVENLGKETVSFSIRFVDLSSRDRTYVWRQDDGTPVLFQLAVGKSATWFFAIRQIDPTYNPAAGGDVPRFYVELFNEREARTLYTYFAD